ncbi:MAG TPA: hypothetical protein VKU02_27735 [Gemmataceae bacterium]|nr:hypothetical protein [Gemmataceae bacterium]
MEQGKSPTPPFWFRQRQGKAEPAGPDTYRLTAPNLGEALISIQQTTNGRWLPVLKRTAEGPNLVEAGDDFATPQEAWDAAFEWYRVHIVV